MSPRSRSALARYLDKVQALYPSGIPKVHMTARRSARPLCALIVISPSGSLNVEEQGLVDSIRSKALKVAAEQCVVVVRYSESEISGEELPGCVSIIFGASSNCGVVVEDAGSVTLRTHSLADMQREQSVKREVWGHIKSVLPHMSRG